MSKESGQIATCGNGMADLFSDKKIAPASLRSEFAFQIQRSPKREKWVARFSAQAVLARFYLEHLEDYERMFKGVFQITPEDYSKLPPEELVNVQEREEENNLWLDFELPESLYSLGRKITSLNELEVLLNLLKDTMTRIKHTQKDYSDFEAQLAFFDEPMRFVVRLNETLPPSKYIIVEFEDEDFVTEVNC